MGQRWMRAGLRALGVLAVVMMALAAHADDDAPSVKAGSMNTEQQDGPFFSDWRVEGLRSHPLVGKVWSREAGALVEPGDLTAAVRAARIVLLGEIHDNNDHHRVQAHVLGVLADQKPAVVFEQFRGDVQAALAAAQEQGIASIAALKAAVDWENSGWKSYDYDPLFRRALDEKLAIFAGDVPRGEMMTVAKEGSGALAEAERVRLSLDRPLGAAADAAALDEIFEAHCEMMPKEALSGMAAAQRLRDARLADAVLAAANATGRPVVLIAGSGHVRSDRGVPWYLRARAPEKPSVAVVLAEVEDGETDPAAYVPRDPDGKPAADFLLFTPRAERGDPCAEMRARKKSPAAGSASQDGGR